MYSFNSDYSEGACDAILQAMVDTNRKQSVGYGLDEECDKARTLIREQLQSDTCDIHFLVGGTQCNQVVISSALRPYEAVIAAKSGHINVHETGAIEASGHKVLVADSEMGKVLPQGIRAVMNEHVDEHMVKPAMVYISNATEIGTVYTKAELKALRDVCDEYGLLLYMDGARLPMALVANDSDLELADLAKYFDVCYLGGTKCGALFGEAVVIFNDALKQNFRFSIKQQGAMLAKGRLLGLQFSVLFEENRYLNLADHAVKMAQKLQEGMEQEGISFFVKTTTNQIFPIFEQKLLEQMAQKFQFQLWEKLDDKRSAVRFVTSWACEEQAVDECLAWLKHYLRA